MQTFTEKIELAIVELWPKAGNNPFVSVWVDLGARLVALVIIVLVLAIIRKLLDTVIVKFFKSATKGKQHVFTESRLNALMGISRSMLRYGVYFLGALTILPEFGVNVSALLTAAGVGGLAVGFGAQNLVRDVIAGFFILMEAQFDVGDFVSIAETEGVVESIGLRTTTLLDFSGSRHIIPNGEIKLVTNNMGNAMRVLVEFTVGYENNLDYVKSEVEKICEQLASELPSLVQGPQFVGVQGFSEAGLVLRVRANSEPMMQWSTERKIREAIYKGLNEKGVKISYPRLQIVGERGQNNEQ